MKHSSNAVIQNAEDEEQIIKAGKDDEEVVEGVLHVLAGQDVNRKTVPDQPESSDCSLETIVITGRETFLSRSLIHSPPSNESNYIKNTINTPSIQYLQSVIHWSSASDKLPQERLRLRLRIIHILIFFKADHRLSLRQVPPRSEIAMLLTPFGSLHLWPRVDLRQTYSEE